MLSKFYLQYRGGEAYILLLIYFSYIFKYSINNTFIYICSIYIRFPIIFFQNKLDKEETFAKINTAKINQQWRYILRKIKCKQMSQDIQVFKLLFSSSLVFVLLMNTTQSVLLAYFFSKRVWFWVRSLLERGVDFRQSTRNASRIRRKVCLNTRFSLPILLCTLYSMKLMKKKQNPL